MEYATTSWATVSNANKSNMDKVQNVTLQAIVGATKTTPIKEMEKRADLGPYAPQGSTTLLPKLSVTLKVSARTSCAWVGSRVRFRSSEDVTLLEFTSPVDREYMRRCQKFH